MRKIIHRVLTGIPAATVSTLLAAVTFGGEAVRLKIAHAASAVYNDEGSRIAVFLVATLWLAAWIVTEEHVWDWLRNLRKLPPTLYLRNTSATGGFGKTLVMQWVEETLTLNFRGDGHGLLDKIPLAEKGMAFELFNAGEEVRHVVVRWRLPQADMRQMSKVLGPPLRSFDGQQIKLAQEGRASMLPVATDIESTPIPLISKGQAVTITAPKPFMIAYSICAFARAREHYEKVIMPALGKDDDPTAVLERFNTRMDTALVDLSCVKGGRKCSHSFTIDGFLWGGGQPALHKPTDEAPNLHELTAGISAHVDEITVRHL